MVVTVQETAATVNQVGSSLGGAREKIEQHTDSIRRAYSELDAMKHFLLTEIPPLIRGIQDGSASINDAVEYLAKSQLRYGQMLAETIKLYQEGKASFQAILALVRFIHRTYPDSQLDDLARTLEAALLKGNHR
jgi:ABC-type transporter Mla subunit MlaD